MNSFSNLRSKLRIAVLGPHECSAEEYALGRKVGELIARAGAILLCGGLNGVMTAAAEGAHNAGGLTIGLLPGDSADSANPYIHIPLPSGLGVYRNVLLVRSADAAIAVGGHYGTLTEMSYALRLGTPLVALRSWSLQRDSKPDPGVHAVETPEEAVRRAMELARRHRS